MLKKINQLLKLIGLNLVHAKRPKAKIARRAKAYVAGSCVPSPTCCVDEYNAKSDCRTYPARSAFTTADDGQTHYVGDACPGGHVDASPTQDNNITGPTS